MPATSSVDRVTPLDVEARLPVWSAVSDLFLDTSHDHQDIARIASILARSPYSLEELDQILVHEVYPACCSNFMWIAGAWGMFDTVWLEARILRGPSRLRRLWSAVFARGAVSWPEWKEIKHAVTIARAA
jgi:hypothetical protein